MLYAFKLKETSKIKKIKSDKTVGFKSQSLNIMGQFGWELISTPLMGPQTIIFKKKFKITEFIFIHKLSKPRELIEQNCIHTCGYKVYTWLYCSKNQFALRQFLPYSHYFCYFLLYMFFLFVLIQDEFVDKSLQHKFVYI